MADHKAKVSLLYQLRSRGYSIPSPCGGIGKCGKCRIRVTEGFLPITIADKNRFSNEELKNGWRLSCMAYPITEVSMHIPEDNPDEYKAIHVYQNMTAISEPEYVDPGFFIAIDIGTTTIAMDLLGSYGNYRLASYTAKNSGVFYGGDVISRIYASNTGKRIEMQSNLLEDIKKGITFLLSGAQKSQSEIDNITIAANTTMVHILMGYSCEGLAAYPFKPITLDRIQTDSHALLKDEYFTGITILPGFSAFVGSDILSGLYYCNFHDNKKTALFVDLGTNGEIVLGNQDRILYTSVAAGPAFEGGNISCGTGSIPGAIYDVNNVIQNPLLKTIDHKPPVGLCGTGSLSLIYELRRNDWIDPTGLFRNPYLETGFPFGKTATGTILTFTQKDVREMQLAIASVRAGIETLLQRYSLSYDQIDVLYLAGGFGYHIDIDKAVGVGLLPKELSSRTQAVGNTSLGGAAKYSVQSNSQEACESIRETSEEVSLANDTIFQETFISSINFPINH